MFWQQASDMDVSTIGNRAQRKTPVWRYSNRNLEHDQPPTASGLRSGVWTYVPA